MNEISKKRREWVKTAAIVFLSVMLVLTFFSNTIMNYSLPEVAAKYVEPGSITAKIRGNGVVESSDPYEVTVKQTRKVMSVAVREGDKVQQGDVLVYLEDTESEELKAALKALETAQEAYDLALLAADVNAGMIQNANDNIPVSTYRQQINNAQAAVKAAEAEVEELKKELKDVEEDIADMPANDADMSDETEEFEEAKEAYEDAQNDLAEAKNEVAKYESLLQDDGNGLVTDDYNYLKDYLDTVSTGDTSGDKLSKVLEAKRQANLNLISAQNRANDAQLEYDIAKQALDNKKAEGDTSEYLAELNREKASLQFELNEAEDILAEKEKELSDLTGNINKTLNLENLYQDIVDAQSEVDEEMEKTTDAVIKAEISGTITQINATAGKDVSAAEAVAVIQPEGKGYTMSFSVTNEQARRLSVGDKADLVNSWYYNDMDITLSGIRPDKNNPGKQKTLTFDVTGDVIAGQSLNVSVGQKSANYDLIVPNSAIREDNNGKFVLIVESKSSPLGNRYVATRVDVEVIASDDTQSAINGALYGYEFVITTSTKPVEAGQLVRLAEN